MMCEAVVGGKKKINVGGLPTPLRSVGTKIDAAIVVDGCEANFG